MEKKNTDGPMHSPQGWGQGVSGREPTCERAWFRAASSARSSETLREGCGGRSDDSGLAADAVMRARMAVQEQGTPWTWTRGRARV